MSSKLVFVSRDLQGLYGRRAAGSVLIRNGAATVNADTALRPATYAAGKANLLILGRLDKIKNIGLAIRALASPELRHSTLLHIVGEGPERSDLESLAAQLGLAEAVLFHGFQDNPVPYFAHADMLLLPSLHEGTPYVVLEAMQLGIPIVASSVGGIPDILQHQRSALLITPTDCQSLIDAVSRLMGDSGLRSRLTRAAREEFLLHWSADAMIAEYRRLYDHTMMHGN
jgi:glycosyltransferase involved in cell wall biosynthesis